MNRKYTVRVTTDPNWVKSKKQYTLTQLNQMFSFSIDQTSRISDLPRDGVIECNTPEGSVEVKRVV